MSGEIRIVLPLPIEERIGNDAVRASQRGRKVVRVRVSLADFDDMVARLSAKTHKDGNGVFLTMHTAAGSIRVERSDVVRSRGEWWCNEAPIDPTGKSQATPGG
jgi:hypothetical protein